MLPTGDQVAEFLPTVAAIVFVIAVFGVGSYILSRAPESVKVLLAAVGMIGMIAIGVEVSFPDVLGALIPAIPFVVIFGGIAVLLVIAIGVAAVLVPVVAVLGLAEAIINMLKALARSSKALANRALANRALARLRRLRQNGAAPVTPEDSRLR